MVNKKSRPRKKIKVRKRSILAFSFIILFTYIFLSLTGLLEGQAFGNSSGYSKIVIKKGDTLWNLAKKYGPENQDIRKTVYEIKKLNEITDPYLRPGDLILIP